MLQSVFIPVLYLISAVLFILGLKQLSHPRTAPKGNRTAALGMFIAIVSTLLVKEVISFHLVIAGVVIGGLIGAVAARRVEMTSMPQLVAMFNGLGGGASLLVATAEFYRLGTQIPVFTFSAIANSIFIGGITLTGSLVAFSKLQGIMRGAPITFAGRHLLNGAITVAIIALATLAAQGSMDMPTATLVIIGLSLLLGYLFVIPVGGADMPVVISLLNSFSGLAAATTGFVLVNNSLIISGSLVGASGIILTNIMCKGMNNDKLFDLDDINPDFEETEVALIIGANDVVNPAARHDTSSPLFGMPILDVDKAQTVFVLKRSMNPGFAGVENELFFNDNTIMLFGDAKDTVSKLVSELK